MKLYFSEEHREKDLNQIELEEDAVFMAGDFIEGSGKNYVMGGTATIDNEVYREFQIEFELMEGPKEESIEAIMEIEWEWYDYLLK